MELSPLALIGIFLSGLALNLTPCVYPMLTVTIAIFGARTEKKLGASFGRALLYFLGIILMYSILGAIAAASGSFFGAFLQSSWILSFIAVAMAVLALSMFGLYEFSLPPALLNLLGGTKKVGLFGIFLSGLLVGVFAAPCVGPPIIALFTIASQSADPFKSFFLFFVLALGLGAPYLVLGTFSGLLERLPKSGSWLLWIKKLFGVALLGLAFFYFALALYPDLVQFVFPITLVLGAIYLGFIERSGNQNKAFSRFKRISGALLLLGIFLFLFARPKAHVVWEPYSSARLEQAKAAHEPVIIDFYADWCIPCHELEQYTYTSANVIKALERFVRLKVDVTRPGSTENAEPIQKFGVIGVPTVVFLDEFGNEVNKARFAGFVPPEQFMESVKLVEEASKEREVV